MAKFKKGDRVRVVSVESADIEVGISVGDTATVLQDNSTVPYLRMDKYNENLLNAYWVVRKRTWEIYGRRRIRIDNGNTAQNNAQHI
jgi:hypothetical protein